MKKVRLASKFKLAGLVAGLLLWACPALAQTSVLIVVRGQDSTQLHAFEQRLRLELSAEGYAPTTINVSFDPNAAVLLDTAKRLTSSAAISISVQDGVVSGMVWIVDQKKPGGLLRAVTDLPANDQAPAVFAIAATDALHGGLLELGYIQDSPPEASKVPQVTHPQPAPQVTQTSSTASTSQPSVPSTDPAKAKKWDHRDGWFMSLGASQAIALGNLPSSTEIGGTLSRRLGTRWAIGLHGSYALPLLLHDTTSGATASVDQLLASARVELIQALVKRLTTFEYIDTGVQYFSLSGQAAPPLKPVVSHGATVYHELGLGGVLNINSDFGLYFGSSLRLPYKPTDVTIVSRTVGRLGSPTLTFGGGLQFSLF